MVYFQAASNRIVSALGEAGTTPLAGMHAAGDRRGFLRLLGRMTAVALAVSLAGVIVALLAGRPILHAFYGPDYAAQSTVLVMIMVATAAANLQTMLDYAMTAARNFKVQPYLYSGGALLLLGLCVVLVPRRGIVGAAIALGLASLAEIAASAAIVIRALVRIGRPVPVAVGTAP
jgi:O-antigen/teichoic acid export membrane protein